ncbi:hypothetical protein RI129_006809 [Pyrocoelia pectoralis]|uniref:BTB domain-containing protein n=1 Tax=Pyrocoelia pectoralis TaxID=417401 RepID=A0AAN7VKA8_9COLE
MEMKAAVAVQSHNGLDSSPHKSIQSHSTGCNTSDLGDMSFMMFDYIKEAMKAMDMMRKVGAELFHAHRLVLAAASPYFKAMFTGGLRECDMNRVQLQGVSATVMARLIHFMYTGRIRVTENTVCQLLPAATMFQVCILIIKIIK